MKNLTAKLHAFAQAYCECNNRVEAYRRSYRCEAMLDNTIARKAQEVASLPHVAEMIRKIQGEAAARNRVSVDETLRQLSAIAYSDITDFVEFDGTEAHLRDITRLAPEQRYCIREIDVHSGGGFRIRLHDKLRAIELLGKHLGMFDPRAVAPCNFPMINLCVTRESKQT